MNLFIVLTLLIHSRSLCDKEVIIIFFYLGFLPQPFTNHRTAGEGGGDFFNSSLPLPPASKTFRH